jgi:hypothetical protein
VVTQSKAADLRQEWPLSLGLLSGEVAHVDDLGRALLLSLSQIMSISAWKFGDRGPDGDGARGAPL